MFDGEKRPGFGSGLFVAFLVTLAILTLIDIFF